MIYLTTNSDGNNTEGIGAMVQYQIICYILSKINNFDYLFEGFRNLTHYQHYNITKEQWNYDINNFFNLPIQNLPTNYIKQKLTSNIIEEKYLEYENLLLDCDVSLLMKIADNIIDEQATRKILFELKNNLNFDHNFYYFDNKKINISFHLRTFTNTDCDPDPFDYREYFSIKRVGYYSQIIKKIDFVLKKYNIPCEYHIYSQGHIDDFNFFNTLDVQDIKFHINEYPLISLYHMINSNILICSNSSFSYISHLLNDKSINLVRQSFIHKWKKESINLEKDGNFNIKLFENKIKEIL